MNAYIVQPCFQFIRIAGKASADAKVTVKATANGVSRTYEPVRDGEDFAIDIPVDVSRGEVATDLEVNAVRFDAQQDVDLYRRLSGRYTVTPNAANAMAYDADGNLLSYDGWTLAWNGENRLVQMEKGSHRETYDYDYMGRRFVKKVYGKENDAWSLVSEEYFVYDGYRQIAAYAGASRTLARTYAWDAAGLDTPLWTSDAAGSYFYVADANKNIRMLFNESGEPVAEYDYDPFGQVTATGDYAATNPYRFSSEYHDDGTGMVYYNYRYYSPKLGRWTSRDPIGEEGGENLYGIINNNLVNKIDILGLKSLITLRDFDAFIPNGSEDMRLAYRLALHYLLGRGKLFTHGASVVKSQDGVKAPVRALLLGHAIQILTGTSNTSVKWGSVHWTMQDTGPILANDSFWMLHTLNGATDFDIRGRYLARGCSVTYNLKYVFIDRADMHMSYFPDMAIIITNYMNLLYHLHFINQEYDIRISWIETTTITRMSPGLKLEGWPF